MQTISVIRYAANCNIMDVEFSNIKERYTVRASHNHRSSKLQLWRTSPQPTAPHAAFLRSQCNHTVQAIGTISVRAVFVGVVALTGIFEVAFIVLIAVAAHQALHALQLLHGVTRNK
jgi:hypothetical protein